MLQTTLCVALEVKPESAPRLAQLVAALNEREDAHATDRLGNFARLQSEVPAAHFLSMCVFGHPSYDPLFVVEANFDGAAGPFWAQFEAALGPALREMLRCCKRPDDGCAALHDSVTAAGSRAPLAPYLEARTTRPSVFFHGNRGVGRDRVRAESELALAAEAELDGPDGAALRAMPTDEIHRALRARLRARFPWLAEPAAERITGAENAADLARLALYVSVVLAALLLPGALAYAALGPALYVGVCALLAAAGAAALRREGGLEGLLPKPKPAGTPPPPIRPGAGALAKLALVAALAALGAALVLFALPALASLALAALGQAEAAGLWPLFGEVLRAALWGLVGLLALLPGLAWLLRFNERRDSPQDAPPLDARTVAEIARREDRVTQNHMASLVLIRPGVMRAVVIRAGHLGLHLLLRVLPEARQGFLGAMRTVHFAHWAFLNNNARLLFVSNFDHSWGSYLDDFIEKAHGGLTLAWGCSTGFPRTSWLVRGGAADGRRFKTYALASRAVSRFWYSAYPWLTVERIERNAEIAKGLRRSRLGPKEAQAWLRLL